MVIFIPLIALSPTKSLPSRDKYKGINERTTTTAKETNRRVIKHIFAMNAHVEGSLQKQKYERDCEE